MVQRVDISTTVSVASIEKALLVVGYQSTTRREFKDLMRGLLGDPANIIKC
jgi:hypothetical protein